MIDHLIHKDLIEQCKKGGRQAQYKLYRLYSTAMYNICLRMVKNEMDAEDILQNSFIDVFTKLESFRYESTIGAWIKRIVINNCINFLRSKKIHFEELDDRFKENTEKEPEIGHSDVNVRAVNEAVFQLPTGYRTVFTLYLIEGYDHKEISQILNISEATSKSQYSRARRKVKEILLSQQFTPNYS